MAKKEYSLAHTKWMCKYHIVFTPKYRRKVIYNQYKEDIRDIIKQLCSYKGVEIIEGHLMPDHIHMLVSIPPKISVSMPLKGRATSQEQYGLNGAVGRLCKQNSHSLKRKPAPWDAGLVTRAYSPRANHPLDGWSWFLGIKMELLLHRWLLIYFATAPYTHSLSFCHIIYRVYWCSVFS